MLTEAAGEAGANLLLHPVVGLDQPGDADHYTRVRCYQEFMPHFASFMARLNLLPMAPRGGGPREAVLQAIVHKNYGCTHLWWTSTVRARYSTPPARPPTLRKRPGVRGGRRRMSSVSSGSRPGKWSTSKTDGVLWLRKKFPRTAVSCV